MTPTKEAPNLDELYPAQMLELVKELESDPLPKLGLLVTKYNALDQSEVTILYYNAVQKRLKKSPASKDQETKKKLEEAADDDGDEGW